MYLYSPKFHVVIGESFELLPVEELSSKNCHLYNQWSIQINWNQLLWKNKSKKDVYFENQLIYKENILFTLYIFCNKYNGKLKTSWYSNKATEIDIVENIPEIIMHQPFLK
jgi:hypothetical protein